MDIEKFKPQENISANVKFPLRLTEELHEELATYSQKHNISMNTLILKCVEYAMKNREDK